MSKEAVNVQDGYRCLKKIRSIDKQIDLVKRQLNEIQTQVVQDRVDASSHCHPYTQYSLIIKGVEYNDSQRILRYKRRLEHLLAELMDAKADVVDFIGGIDDPELHDILESRFIKGLTYSEIAAKLHYSDESVPRKRVNRFFAKSK